MSGYTTFRFGELQERILKHFFDCKDDIPESVNHISHILGVVQPAVFKSVSLLIKEGYLVKDPEYKDGKKVLLVTDKGAAAAVMLGISYDQMANYFFKLSKEYGSRATQLDYLRRFENMFRIPDKREFLVGKMMNYFLKNNMFEKSGHIKWPLSHNELKLLSAYVNVEYNKVFGNVRTVKAFVDKYGMDKKFLKTLFEKDRKRIDSILKQLED
jgi:hypothetical protein